MAKQVVVLGLGRFGGIVATRLAELGHEVMGCDRDAAVVAAMAPRLTQALQLDATDADAIAEVGPGEFDVVVVALDPAATILATMLLTRMGATSIVARAASELDGEILRRVGAGRVVYTDQMVATWVAHTIDLADATDYIRLSSEVAAVHLMLGDRVAGQRLGDVDRQDPTLRIVALHRGEQVFLDPDPETIIQAGDGILVVGPERGFRSLER
jgi:trk/ktr system potassium uptake protein